MIARIASSMLKHPHCYQWTLVIIAFLLATTVGGVVASFFLGLTLGLAVYGQIKRTFDKAFFVA